MSTEESSTPTLKKDKITRKKTACFSMGVFNTSILAAAYGYVIFFYYEVEVGLPTALVGLSFVIYALWNMINDPLLGYFTDKPMRWSKKYGLRAPWVLFGGILLVITYYFLFAIPENLDVKTDPWGVFWYMVIVTCLFDTWYSVFTTHYFGGFANIFRTKEQRRKASTLVMLIGLIGRTICVAFIMPAVIILGDPASYIRFGLVTSIIMFTAMIILIPGIYENEFVKKRYLQIFEFLETQKMPYFTFVKTVFKQKNFMILLVCATFFTMGLALQQASFLFMIQDVLKFDIGVLTIVTLGFMLSFLPALYIWSHFVAKKVDHSKVYAIGMTLMGVMAIQTFWLNTVEHFLILNIIGGTAVAAISSISLSISSDTMDEVNYACGRHVEAALVGFRNFFLRACYLAVGIIIAGIHIATGYVPGAAEQTELAKLGIRTHAGGFPALFFWLGAILMWKYYDLKGEKLDEIKAAMRKKGL